MGLASKRHPGIIYWILIIKPFLPAILCSLFLLSKGNFPYFVSFVKTNESLLQHRGDKEVGGLDTERYYYFFYITMIFYFPRKYTVNTSPPYNPSPRSPSRTCPNTPSPSPCPPTTCPITTPGKTSCQVYKLN